MGFSLFHHFLLFALGISPQTEMKELESVEFPPDFQDVTTWRNNLCGLYHRLSTFLDHMDALTVLEVRHFKSK
jgi:hypothetical protein